MTPEERQMLSGLFDRIRGAASGPKDREAETFIDDAMRNTPSAGYVLAQTVLVQQQALEAAAHRISELEAQSKEAPPAQDTSFLGNLGRSLFGGGPSSPPQPQSRPYDARGYERDPGPPPGYAPQRPGYAPPPPQPGYAPQPQQGGPWGAPPPAQGGGFLHGALQTATGVAGGVLLGNALGGLFGGHSGGGLGGGGGGLFGGGSAFAQPRETVNETVNNYYGSDSLSQRDQDYLQDQDQDQDAMQDADDDYASDDSSGGGDDYA
jgi:hypothetical protein